VKAGGGSAELSTSGDFKAKPDVAIVVFGENPYAEFQGDIDQCRVPGRRQDRPGLAEEAEGGRHPGGAVFLSGRPLWTNPEINAADAFVAAWLPGSEGGGVADVLIGDKAGKARHDFQGKLSFSWPKRVDQEPLNVGDKGYDPQFAYGYGLSYAKPGKVAKLSEDPGAASAVVNVDRYFVGRPCARAVDDERRRGGFAENGRCRTPKKMRARRPGVAKGMGPLPSLARLWICRDRPPATWRSPSATGWMRPQGNRFPWVWPVANPAGRR
jgi:hypothetical protein